MITQKGNRGKYLVDRGSVLKKAYNLLCLFFADKEISRRSDPSNENDPLKSLERMFFESEASSLLLEIAIAIRVLDDQMRKLPESDKDRIQYENLRFRVDSYTYALFDDLNLDLRQVCNKIIHSNIMEPHFSEGYEANEFDLAYKYGEGDKTIDWSHLNGYVRLSGTGKGTEWYVLLDVEIFIKAVHELLSSE